MATMATLIGCSVHGYQQGTIECRECVARLRQVESKARELAQAEMSFAHNSIHKRNTLAAELLKLLEDEK